jgi:diguanylate cyclase (GGDEF)-like protein
MAIMRLTGPMLTIWREHRTDVLKQVAVIEHALSSAHGEALDDELRSGAAREAHNVSGAVGTMGFALAAEHARALERALGAPDFLLPGELPRLAGLAAALREELAMPVHEEPSVTGDAAPMASGDRVTIELLVVDSDAARGALIVAEAQDRSITAGLARSLASAREMFSMGGPDVVLLDLSVSDALESVLGLLAEFAQDTTVLAVTDPARSVDRVEVARRGGRGFLPNSLSPGQTVDAVIALRAQLRTVGTRILALDDDTTILVLLKAMLGQAGMEVSTCNDPDRFLAQLEETSPELLILDFDMPGVTGPELCRAIRNDHRWQGLPIVLLTGHADPDSVRAVFDAGADDYVSKPFVGPELVARIANRLERVRMYRALADTDPLTGLANRRRSVDAIEDYLRLASRMGQSLCLAIIDVDRFKDVNDTHGHAAGDAVLRGVGTELLRYFRGEDVVARWGGDEFLIGMFGMSGADGRRRVNDLLDAMRGQSFDGVSVTISVGLAEYPSDGGDLDSLCAAADRALYEAKSAGRDGIATSTPAPGTGNARP